MLISASSSAPVSDKKRNMMNAAYSTPTFSNDKQRGIIMSGPKTNQFLAGNVKPHQDSSALEMFEPSVPVPSDPNNWSVPEVEAWARTLPHFGNKLGNIMLEFQINGHVLMGLTRDSMKDELSLVFGEIAQLETDIARLRGRQRLQEEGLPPRYDA
ncbi:hypothetical protein HDU81_003170 [Chytriomyces hyalinus]|nr:hypothetical protein HDU81_003170 [Chytriomyces hyalinus]